MHIKKNVMPATWPVPRKGSKYIAVPTHGFKKGITVLYILRDILKIVRSRREAKYMTMNKMVKVNNKIRIDEAFPVLVFDSITLDKSNKSYRLEMVNRKFVLKEINKKDAESKIVKIIGKRVISKSKIQMNLEDGQNFITSQKFSVGDSVVIDTIHDKIIKVLPLKEGSKIDVVIGRHSGKSGKIVRFEELTKGKSYLVKFDDGEVSLPLKSILVVE